MAQTLRVGFMSRMDYGSPGFRRGLLELAFDRFREANVHFVVLVGGLLSWRDLKKVMPRKREEQDAFLQQLAEELAKVLPRMGRNSDIKLYIMVSPAYDGPLGAQVATRLAELRKDIRFYGKHCERFGKGDVKRIAALVPTKAAWRADYASTPVDRVIKDELKRSTQSPAAVYVVGCFGVFVHRPEGESRCTYIALPALHKLEDVSVAENQVGVVILDANEQIAVTNISFKDMVRDERRLISVPEGLNELETKVFERLQEGPQTVGMIEDALRVDRERITRALARLTRSRRRNYPQVTKDDTSGRYDFDQTWFQNELRYQWTATTDLPEDRIVGFACLHAGSVNTDYGFVTEKLPQIILAQNATVLAGVGDFIEGREHNLIDRGEVIGAMSYSKQENRAARLIVKVLFDVLMARIERAIKENKPANPKDTVKLVNQCLPVFVYIEGNHDQWVEKYGFDPLTVFRLTLIDKLRFSILSMLETRGLPFTFLDIRELVERKVVAADKIMRIHALRSGVKVGLLHPHQGRAETTSLRLQRSLAAMSRQNCRVGLIGNFHTSAAVASWEPELGQRVGVQFGTIKHGSKFETNLTKVVDFGIGCLTIRSKDGRIVESQTVFLGGPEVPKFDNDKLFEELDKLWGI